MQPVARADEHGLKGGAKSIAHRFQPVDAVQRHRQLTPAHDVQCHELRLDATGFDAHLLAALRAGFVGMPALKIAGKDNARLLAHHLARVNMPERPVVVAFRHQRRDIGRCVAVVPDAPRQAGVQHADVEKPRNRRRVGRH